MGSAGNDGWGDEFSEIAEKGEIGFIDYEDDNSVCSYNPRDEGDVVISVPFPFVGGKPQSIFMGGTSKCLITIENTTSESVELWGTKIFCSNPADSFTLSLMEPPSADSSEEHTRGFLEGFSLEDRVLQPNSTLTIWLSCKPKDMGLHTSVVHFDVGDDRFERVVFLLAEDKISQSLASNNPFVRKPRTKQMPIDDFVLAARPGKPNGAKEYKNGPRLPQFIIPKAMRELLENKQEPEVIAHGLTRANYAAYFTALLNMEELHLEEEIRSYDLECAKMRRKGINYLALEVPGLAEKRPSLVSGDFVVATLASQRSNGNLKPYQGYIHRVEADEVRLKFATEFHKSHRDGDSYNISFTCNRVLMRRLYQAVQEAAKLENTLLFPSQSTTTRLITPSPIVPITCNINEEQLRAVEMILDCKGAPPYVIFGPPGTGKTLTLIEAILQLYSKKGGARILVCAASNSAADHILDRLIGNKVFEVKESEIFRLNAPSRQYDDVHPHHIRFCFFEDSVFQCPPHLALMRYKIVVSTYMSTYLLYQEGLRRGHFSHLFLDEAGQASEPDIMVPIALLCKKETTIVLAGDPMQLGPVVYSRVAESSGLGKSYLERLFESEFYQNEDDNYVVKLVRNYRCHPAILDLPSKLFYNGDLLACKEDADSSYGDLSFDFLPNKEFPVVFFGIQGCDEREGNNPSWFNRFEASKVVEIIKKLTRNSDSDDPPDIGIITPYRKQVEKLSKALENMCMEGVKVGSVEQFQGQEREVIIVSTVRSTIKHNDYDKTFRLGFLSNPKRFNVAITRARSLLVIVGNPHIISEDPFWDKLLRYCADNNSYLGCDLPERKTFEEESFNPINNDETFDPAPSNDWQWGDTSYSEEAPALPEPVTDESQWSDGWNS